ncbi:unnamed protein product [Fraxinus pennsylvanica]|uniref:Uncharacterized protein n=1 Tax=Fraxinus pennsylvanica TaxID=56036 RepID=A0AAD1ZTM8_9LAMI|nr:unnamed protein product [Fraxinus pennsylvanica]
MGLYKLAAKLKATKTALKFWNKQVFGRVENAISELEEKVETLEAELQMNTSESLENEFLETKMELLQWQKREEICLSQQAKKKCLNEDDNNTKFFHASIAQKRRSSKIENMLLSNGTVLSSPKEVHDAAVHYFQNFLTESHTEPLPNLSEYIGECISSDEGDQLSKGLVDVGSLGRVGSRFWKAVVDCFPDVVANSQWKIKEGKISFWYDNWLEEGPTLPKSGTYCPT